MSARFHVIRLGRASGLTQSKGFMFPEDVNPTYRFNM